LCPARAKMKIYSRFLWRNFKAERTHRHRSSIHLKFGSRTSSKLMWTSRWMIKRRTRGTFIVSH
jgi:hypothetical protein